MRHQEDPFIAAAQKDPGLSSERVERPAATGTTERQRTPNPQLGARNESSVLFKLTDIQAASAASPADDLPIHVDPPVQGRQPRPTGFIELGHFEAPQSLATVIPMGLLQPRGTTTYIPRWVWGLAAGGAALLIAVVGMTLYLVRSPGSSASEVAVAEPVAEPASAAGPARPVAAAPVAPAAPVKLVAAAPSKPAAASSTAPVARARAKAAHHAGKRSARRVARSSSKSSLPTSADVPAPRAKASGRDELDKILGGSVAH